MPNMFKTYSYLLQYSQVKELMITSSLIIMKYRFYIRFLLKWMLKKLREYLVYIDCNKSVGPGSVYIYGRILLEGNNNNIACVLYLVTLF